MPRPRLSLDTVRARVRRFQLIVGIGFGAAAVGSIIVSPATAKLTAVGPVGHLVALVFLQRLWVWLVLPLICYGVARVVPLRPLSAAIGTALTGELFLSMLILISGGVSGLIGYWPDAVARVGTLVAGIVLSRWAILRARAQAEKAQQQATAIADKQKDQYAEFAREAERLAALHEAREARAGAAVSGAPPSDAPPTPTAAPPSGSLVSDAPSDAAPPALPAPKSQDPS